MYEESAKSYEELLSWLCCTTAGRVHSLTALITLIVAKWRAMDAAGSSRMCQSENSNVEPGVMNVLNGPAKVAAARYLSSSEIQPNLLECQESRTRECANLYDPGPETELAPPLESAGSPAIKSSSLCVMTSSDSINVQDCSFDVDKFGESANRRCLAAGGNSGSMLTFNDEFQTKFSLSDTGTGSILDASDAISYIEESEISTIDFCELINPESSPIAGQGKPYWHGTNCSYVSEDVEQPELQLSPISDLKCDLETGNPTRDPRTETNQALAGNSEWTVLPEVRTDNRYQGRDHCTPET